MKALITGASSGLGADMARVLSEKGYDLILVARRKRKLEALKEELKTEVDIINMDLASPFNCKKLFRKVEKEEIDLFINNAGFGVFGNFEETNIDKELDLIDLNMKTVHMLTKLFIQKFEEQGHGMILNVASSAAFLPGPLMAAYYASKAYVLRLTEAIYEELRQKNSPVVISALCPGPVATEFSTVAKVNFAMKALSSREVAEYAIDQLFRHKLIIIPGTMMKLGVFFQKFLPVRLILDISYKIQTGKKERE